MARYLGLAVGALRSAWRTRPDVIEAHFLVPTALIARGVAALVRTPYVLVAHGTDVSVARSSLMLRFVGSSVRRAAAVHANSGSTAQAILEQFGRPAEIIPPGVDLALFAGDRVHRNESGTVGFVGTLDDHMGVDLLVEAAAGSERPWRLVIAGDGPKRTAYESLARRRGLGDRVEFVGVVSPSRLPALLRSIDVLALPSRREALGMAAIEALAAGTPVVVSDLEGPASIPDEASGSVIPVGDIAALRTAIQRWLDRANDPEVAEAARRRARRYDANRLATEALESLRSATAGKE